MAEGEELSAGSCFTILTDNMGMWHVSTKFIPQLLMVGQKENQLNICTDLAQQAEADENL
jgi:hypothetical protein